MADCLLPAGQAWCSCDLHASILVHLPSYCSKHLWCRPDPFRSRYLHPNHHCCQLLQSNVWTLLTSLMRKSESATASRSTISSAQKPKNRSSLSESLKRSVSITGNAFLRLDFQKHSQFHFVHKDNANGAGELAEVSSVIIHKILMRMYGNFLAWKQQSLPIMIRHLGTFCPQPPADVFRHCPEKG